MTKVLVAMLLPLVLGGCVRIVGDTGYVDVYGNVQSPGDGPGGPAAN